MTTPGQAAYNVIYNASARIRLLPWNRLRDDARAVWERAAAEAIRVKAESSTFVATPIPPRPPQLAHSDRLPAIDMKQRASADP